jgi:hypothetical protein
MDTTNKIYVTAQSAPTASENQLTAHNIKVSSFVGQTQLHQLTMRDAMMALCFFSLYMQLTVNT